MNDPWNTQRNAIAWARMSREEMSCRLIPSSKKIITPMEARRIRKAMLWILGVDKIRDYVHIRKV